jgi:hypothetical protein
LLENRMSRDYRPLGRHFRPDNHQRPAALGVEGLVSLSFLYPPIQRLADRVREQQPDVADGLERLALQAQAEIAALAGLCEPSAAAHDAIVTAARHVAEAYTCCVQHGSERGIHDGWYARLTNEARDHELRLFPHSAPFINAVALLGER